MENLEKHAAFLSDLEKMLRNQTRLLIFLHDNPDPDAIASGWAMKYLVEKRFGFTSRIAYGGFVGRAENRAMIRILKIPLSRSEHIRFHAYDRIAMLDTQPGAKNNSLPDDVRCDLIVDHHPRKRGLKSGIIVIDTEIGATATFLVEQIINAGLDIPSDLATALSYAIRSETQDLGREAGARDIRAYLNVLPLASMRKLAHVIHPKLPRAYFTTLGVALHRAKMYRNIVCTHIGEVPYPEIVAEMADFLLNHERISWSLCTGRYQGSLYLSLRSANTGAKAWHMLRLMVPEKNSAGGHDTFAGGKINLKDGTPQDMEKWEQRLSLRFLSILGYKDTDCKPLVTPSQSV